MVTYIRYPNSIKEFRRLWTCNQPVGLANTRISLHRLINVPQNISRIPELECLTWASRQAGWGCFRARSLPRAPRCSWPAGWAPTTPFAGCWAHNPEATAVTRSSRPHYGAPPHSTHQTHTHTHTREAPSRNEWRNQQQSRTRFDIGHDLTLFNPGPRDAFTCHPDIANPITLYSYHYIHKLETLESLKMNVDGLISSSMTCICAKLVG